MIHANMPFSELREAPGLHIKLSKGRGTTHVREEQRASGVTGPLPKLRLSSSGSKVFPGILPSLTEPADELTLRTLLSLSPPCWGVGNSKLLGKHWRSELRSSCLHSKSSLIH